MSYKYYDYDKLEHYEVKIPSRYEYNIIDKENYGIFTKIDWVTMIFNDCSMYDVLCFLDMQDSVIEFSLGQFEMVRGLSTNFVFTYNGVKLEVSDLHFYMDESKLDLSVFDLIMRRVRLDLSGGALDYLRSCGYDVDTRIYDPPVLPEQASYHFTRIDWAYDFINYCPTFMNEFKRYIDNNILDTGRVPCRGVKGGYEAGIKTGKEFTIYIGSGKSDRLLRCYDKRLQFIDRESGVYIKSNPYNNPDSWFRIEWQCRNEFADELILSGFSKIEVLKKLYDRYKFSEKLEISGVRQDVRLFDKLLNWEEITLPAIRQNLHLVKPQSLPERIISWEESIAEFNNMLYEELRPALARAKHRQSFFDNLFKYPNQERRLNAICNKLNNCHINIMDYSKRRGIVFYKNRHHYIDLDLGVFPEGYLDFIKGVL